MKIETRQIIKNQLNTINELDLSKSRKIVKEQLTIDDKLLNRTQFIPILPPKRLPNSTKGNILNELTKHSKNSIKKSINKKHTFGKLLLFFFILN